MAGFQATSPLADLCASSRARGVALLVALDADVGDAEGFDRVLWLRQGKLLPQDEVRSSESTKDVGNLWKIM